MISQIRQMRCDSVHFKTGVGGTSTVVLGNSDVLGNSAAYFESHSVVHLLFDATAVGQDQDDIDTDEDANDENENLSTDSVGALNQGLLESDVLFLVKVNAYFRLGGKVCTDVLHDVLCSDIATESQSVDRDRWPVESTVLCPRLGILLQNFVVRCCMVRSEEALVDTFLSLSKVQF